MRIGIDVRPLQLESYKSRGIGNHLRGWIEAAQSLASPSRFSLLFDPDLPPPSIKLSSNHWNLEPFVLAFPPNVCDPAVLHVDQDEEFRFDSAVEAFLLDHEYDLFHATSSLMWETFVARRIRCTPWVVTFYDLIPLLFRNEYLDLQGERARFSFAQRAGASVYARRVQTTSRATMNDLVHIAGLDPTRIDVVYGGVDSCFVPLPRHVAAKTLADWGLSIPYIFSVSGFHHTKNLQRLLEAYSLLTDTIRKTYKLVVLCPLSPHAHDIVQTWLGTLGIQDQVVFLQGISQNDLVALYNGATLVVHPTLYEGLGFPILEAMRCGIPVVASNAASMPEIAEGAARMVDPVDVEDIARGVTEVLASPTLQSEMREQGFLKVAPFTWERTATAVLDSYEKAAERSGNQRKMISPRHSSGRRLRISFWSPLNPHPSGVSDYSELLLAELSKSANVDVFIDGYQPSNLPLFDSLPMYDAWTYAYLARHRSYDMNLYQVGNNPLHSYMYKSILDYSGIVTFHDVCIYHFIHAVFALSENPRRFWEEVAYCEGPEVARKAQIDYVKGQLDDYSLSLNKRLVQASRGIVTHSEWAANQVRQKGNAPPIRVIPSGMFILEDDGGRFGRLVRRLLGLPENAFIFGVFGRIHRVKRISVVLRAFACVHEQIPNTVLFIMGQVDSSAAGDIYPFQTNSEYARAQGVYLDPNYPGYDLMLIAMQAVDVGINLRYPTAGETSATLSMLLGQGKPTIVSAIGSFTEYPDLCCPKVPIDGSEEDVLYKQMIGLAKDRSRYRRAVQAAYAFSQKRTWSFCAQQYVDFIEMLLSNHNS